MVQKTRSGVANPQLISKDMMSIIPGGVICCFLALVFWVQTANSQGTTNSPLGEFQEARNKHLEFFTPGLVNSFVVHGEPVWLICASSERFFKEEAEAELTSEHEAEARALLLEFLANGQEGPFKLELAGLSIMYSWKEGKTYAGLYSVPKSKVRLVKALPETSAPQPQVVDFPQEGPRAVAKEQAEAAATKPEEPVTGPVSTVVRASVEDFEAELKDLLTRGDVEKGMKLIADADPETLSKLSRLPEKIRLRALVKRGEHPIENLEALAKILHDEGAYERAAEVYSELADKAEERRKDALYQLGVCREKNADFRDAADAFDLYRKDYPFDQRSADLFSRSARLRNRSR